jgi:ribose/xylose/arabinose/galactoside ABC-type transport system permease subunit
MKALIQTGSSLSACGHAQAGGRVSVPLKSDFLSINFAALFYWLLKNRSALSLAELWPVWEVFPTLSAGAALSVALVRTGQLDLLFGVWMALYGASHMVHRRSLPFPIYCGGLAYLAAGIFFLLWPGVSFTDPRPMGLVFGLGELFGGWVLAKRRS